MDIHHKMSCKKGGFITIKNNNLCDLTANLLTILQKFSNRTSNASSEGRVDTQSKEFWVRVQLAFFDVRVFDTNANRYLNKALPQCYIQNENEKKRYYTERVLEIHHGCFTPLVFLI